MQGTSKSSSSCFPQGFNEIQKNVYRFRDFKAKRTTSQMCSCAKHGWNCEDDSCTNRANFKECPNNCPVLNCGNQKIGKLEEKATNVREIAGKGKGVFSSVEIEKDQMLGEYASEVFPEEKFLSERRDDAHAFYAQGYYHDSKNYGNNFRFLNHSCDPNAECQQWQVPGTPGQARRLLIVAIKDIGEGEEITVNYGLNADGDGMACSCGATNCVGTIGEEVVEAEEEEENGETE